MSLLRKTGSICTIFEFDIEVSFTNIFFFSLSPPVVLSLVSRVDMNFIMPFDGCFDGLVGRLGVTNIFHLDMKIDKETLTIIPSQATRNYRSTSSFPASINSRNALHWKDQLSSGSERSRISHVRVARLQWMTKFCISTSSIAKSRPTNLRYSFLCSTHINNHIPQQPCHPH